VNGADLLVAGSGGQAEELRALAAPNPRIKFLGPQPQKALGNLYHHALATLVPSITYETFGIIIVESFARKTPVIVRDLGALPEVVQDSGGGYIYRTDDELAAAIEKIACSPQHRNELGERGYQAFRRYWSKEAHMQLYSSLINDLAMKKFGTELWKGVEVPT
jgi:glycosyltransferase involved in cell wall biosynthesis